MELGTKEQGSPGRGENRGVGTAEEIVSWDFWLDVSFQVQVQALRTHLNLMFFSLLVILKRLCKHSVIHYINRLGHQKFASEAGAHHNGTAEPVSN